MNKGKRSVFVNAKSVKSPRVVEWISKNPKWLMLVIVILPISSAILGYLFENINAFSRSGCVLIAVAIWAVYINHHVVINIEYLRAFYSQNSGLNELSIRKPEIINYLADDKNGDGKELWILTEASKSLVELEFLCGIAGTLIWGLGDLILP